MKRKFQHIAYLLMVAAVITSCGEEANIRIPPIGHGRIFNVRKVLTQLSLLIPLLFLLPNEAGFGSMGNLVILLIRLLQFMMVKVVVLLPGRR